MKVKKEMSKVVEMQEHQYPIATKINVCVRKRPVFHKELESGEIDCVSCSNPAILVHECKYKVDGVTKTVENAGFEFDNTFSERETT